jgi:type I restriction enzyme M protein
VLTEHHKALAGKIWEIANRLRGPYRPPQYRLVMLPMVVLRRLDSVLEPTSSAAWPSRILRASSMTEYETPGLNRRGKPMALDPSSSGVVFIGRSV